MRRTALVGYHTALAGGTELSAEPCDRVEFSDGVALCHNLWHPLPVEFAACDVWYAEPPYRSGYDVFNGRAGCVDPPWPVFQRRIGRLAEEAPVPVVLAIGRDAIRYHPGADGGLPVKHNGEPAWLVTYRALIGRPQTTDEAIHELMQRHECIGDFCAGYGRTGRIAREHGKRFVMSDHNPVCIGVIAKNFAEAR